jgi:integrase
VKRLPERIPPIGRVLVPEEKERLFRVAASNPAWLTAYAAALIAVNTTVRGCELRALKWTDVDLLERTVTVSGSKTDAGLRRIPLNDGGMLGFRLLRDRSAKLGAEASGNYVFPACEHGLVDPNRPQRSWRSAWKSLTKAAALKG